MSDNDQHRFQSDSPEAWLWVICLATIVFSFVLVFTLLLYPVLLRPLLLALRGREWQIKREVPDLSVLLTFVCSTIETTLDFVALTYLDNTRNVDLGLGVPLQSRAVRILWLNASLLWLTVFVSKCSILYQIHQVFGARPEARSYCWFGFSIVLSWFIATEMALNIRCSADAVLQTEPDRTCHGLGTRFILVVVSSMTLDLMMFGIQVFFVRGLHMKQSLRIQIICGFAFPLVNIIWEVLYIVYYTRFLSSNEKQPSGLTSIAILRKLISTWALFSTVATGVNRFARDLNTYGGAPFLLETFRSTNCPSKPSEPAGRRSEFGENSIEFRSRHRTFCTAEISALEQKSDAGSSSSQRGIMKSQTLEQCSEEGSMDDLAEIQEQHVNGQDRWSRVG